MPTADTHNVVGPTWFPDVLCPVRRSLAPNRTTYELVKQQARGAGGGAGVILMKEDFRQATEGSTLVSMQAGIIASHSERPPGSSLTKVYRGETTPHVPVPDNFGAGC